MTNAAAKIGSNGIKNNAIKSKHIKNNNVKSADIKNGGVKAVDLAADAVPSQIDSVTRLPNTGIVVPGGKASFAATPATVAVDANDLIVIDSVLELDPNAVGDTIDLRTCYRVAGSGARPRPSSTRRISSTRTLTTRRRSSMPCSEAVLWLQAPYEVGPCTDVFSGTWSTHSVEGLVTVFDGDAAGPFGKLGRRQARAAQLARAS